jgi:predicted DNA-binding protein (MmcQ/YjbR family)
MTRIRKICLELPESYEEETWGTATFRVHKKIFAMVASEKGSTTASMKALREDQTAMLSQGIPFFDPPYVGSKGWIGIDLKSGALDWEEVAEVVRESYRLVAPKRLSAGMA